MLVLRGVVDGRAARPLLRDVHRDVGALQQLGRSGGVLRRDGHADARADPDLQVRQREGLLEHVDEPVGHRGRLGWPPTPCSSTANSSPPSRTTVPLWRTASSRRCPTWRSSWSPTWWPSVSLTSLNRSRSSSSSATGVPAAKASSRAVSSARRFGSPVSSSVRARPRSARRCGAARRVTRSDSHHSTPHSAAARRPSRPMMREAAAVGAGRRARRRAGRPRPRRPRRRAGGLQGHVDLEQVLGAVGLSALRVGLEVPTGATGVRPGEQRADLLPGPASASSLS